MDHEERLIQHDTDLWSSEYGLRWLAGLVPLPARTTVIRLADRQLIVHSPGPIPADLRRALDALGPVGFLVIPQAHGRFAAAAAQACPSAQLLAAPDPPSSGRSLAFQGSLADAPPAAWSGQVESHLVLGFRLHEVVLFHRPSRTLVLTDLCFNVHHSPSRMARWVFRADGMWRRFGPSRATRLLVSDRAAFRRSLEHILRWDFERIVPGHGEIVEKDGRAALRAAWLGA
jgi:hypothetical protein